MKKFFILFFLLAYAMSAQGQTDHYWSGNTNVWATIGEWLDAPAGSSLGTVPTAIDNVFIDGGHVTVPFSDTGYFDDLNIDNATLTLEGTLRGNYFYGNASSLFEIKPGATLGFLTTFYFNPGSTLDLGTAIGLTMPHLTLDNCTLKMNVGSLANGTYTLATTISITVVGCTPVYDNSIAGKLYNIVVTGTELKLVVEDITYGISLNPSANYTYPIAIYGYGAPTAHSVDVENTGNAPTGTLSIALSGAYASNFTLSTTSIADIAVGGSFPFTVVPNTGLNVGTYTATVTVARASGNTNLISAQNFNVTFIVSKAAAPSITFPTSATDITYGQTLVDAILNLTSDAYGTFAWTNPTIAPIVAQSGSTFEVTYTPYDTYNYDYALSVLKAGVPVTVLKATPPPIVFPTSATNIRCGQPLSASILDKLSDTHGTFGWTSPSYIPALIESGNTFEVTYTPYDSDNYDYSSVTLTDNIAVTIISPTVFVTLNRTHICPGGMVTATPHVSPADAYDYVWYLDGVASGYDQQFSVENLSAGTYEVYVTINNSSGVCEVSSTPVEIIVHDNPVVSITAVNTAICAGSPAELSVTSVVLDSEVRNDANFTWQWARNGITIFGATLDYCTQPLTNSGTYEYTLRMIQNDALGCASDWATPVTITVEKIPQVFLFGDDNTYCFGSSTDLTASVTPAGTYFYDWYVDNVLITTTTINTFTSTGLAARTTPYTYKVIVRSAIDCEGVSNDFAITVKAPPTLNIVTNHTDICPGGNVVATAHVSPTGSYDYVWTFDGTPSGYQQQYALNNLAVGTHTINVNITPVAGSAGCAATVTPVDIVVHANPVVSIAVDKNAVCAGEVVVASATSVALDTEVRNDSDFTWQWMLNGVAVSGAIFDTYTQTLANSGDYEFRLRMVQNNDLGCASTWSAPATVTVEALPQVSLIVNNGIYCTGSDALLTAAVTPVGAYTYDWYLDDVFVVSNSSNTYLSTGLASRVSAYKYHVVVSSALSCDGKSNSVEVLVKDVPTVTMTLNYTDICPGGSIVATANVTPNDNYNYIWYLDGVAGGYQQQFSVSNLSVGSYTLYVEVMPNAGYNGCVVTSTTETFVVHDNPVVTITADNTAFCGNGTVLLSTVSIALDTEVRNDSNFSYQWMVNGGNINGAIGDSYTQYLEPGLYEFMMRMIQNDALGCASEWSAPVNVIVKHVEVPPFFTSDCDEGSIATYRTARIPITVHTISSQNYTTTFIDAAFSSFNYTTGIIGYDLHLGTYIDVRLPLKAGDYNIVITIDGCEYKSIGRVFADNPKLIEQRWSDVLVVNNNHLTNVDPSTGQGFTFYSYQWYKNGELIPGANKQNYTEPGGRLNGSYHVVLNGYAISGGITVPISYVSCPFVPSAQFSMTVYPVPVAINQPLTFSTSLTAEELRGATLEIYDLTGRLVRTITNLSPEMSIPGFSSLGMYVGRVTTKNNGTMNIQFVVQ